MCDVCVMCLRVVCVVCVYLCVLFMCCVFCVWFFSDPHSLHVRAHITHTHITHTHNNRWRIFKRCKLCTKKKFVHCKENSCGAKRQYRWRHLIVTVWRHIITMSTSHNTHITSHTLTSTHTPTSTHTYIHTHLHPPTPPSTPTPPFTHTSAPHGPHHTHPLTRTHSLSLPIQLRESSQAKEQQLEGRLRDALETASRVDDLELKILELETKNLQVWGGNWSSNMRLRLDFFFSLSKCLYLIFLQPIFSIYSINKTLMI